MKSFFKSYSYEMDEIKEQLEDIKFETKENKETLGYIEKKVDITKKEVYSIRVFLFGDKKIDPNNTGVIGAFKDKIERVDEKIDRMEENFDKLEKKQIKYNMMTAVMWASLGATSALIAAYIISKIG